MLLMKKVIFPKKLNFSEIKDFFRSKDLEFILDFPIKRN
jgi:hypothetical protein